MIKELKLHCRTCGGHVSHVSLYNANCLDVLREFPDGCVDSIVTDPPAGIGFMGKKWDDFGRRPRRTFVAFMTEVMTECLRVLRPGGHALVWALPRTAHWTTTAIEDAGFEIRDVVIHLFGQGFPKSLHVRKAIEARREPTDNASASWDGWGTALKPAAEHWILARKTLDGTVAENVLKHGTGGINIDGCRSGRFPANVTLDEEAAAVLDEQSGVLTSGGSAGYVGERPQTSVALGAKRPMIKPIVANSGGASRFFYVAKAPKSDRTAGGVVENKHATVKNTELMRWLCRLITPPGGIVLDPFMGSGSTGVAALREGFAFIGVEAEYASFETARQRITIEEQQS